MHSGIQPGIAPRAHSEPRRLGLRDHTRQQDRSSISRAVPLLQRALSARHRAAIRVQRADELVQRPTRSGRRQLIRTRRGRLRRHRYRWPLGQSQRGLASPKDRQNSS